MDICIALTGNPNSGKTTLFNALTGSHQTVGNWPGVTVEKKEGYLKSHPGVRLLDLPGIYALSPYSLEETITRDQLIAQKPDALIHVLDSTCAERSLYLVSQLLELGIPMVLALNMTDKLSAKVDTAALSMALGCEVVAISALKGRGMAALIGKALDQARQGVNPGLRFFPDYLEKTIAEAEKLLPAELTEHASLDAKISTDTLAELKRFYAIQALEQSPFFEEHIQLSPEVNAKLHTLRLTCEKELGTDMENIFAENRYALAQNLAERCFPKQAHAQTSAKLDAILTHPFLGLPIFALVMFLVYLISVSTLGAVLTDFTNDVLFGTWILPAAQSALENWQIAPWLQGLLVDGGLTGMAAVLGFVPQMVLLFLLLCLLEDCGYMARVAFMMDALFRKLGLSGKSFIPMLIGSGCSVPGIMATRTIENEDERRLTILTTSFIPCGAKMPLIALIAGALLGGAWWAAPLAYAIGIASVVLSALILKKTRFFSQDSSPFMMELPQYHGPDPRAIIQRAGNRAWSFIRRAGTVILACSMLLWFLQSFTYSQGQLSMVEDNSQSLLASAGNVLAPVFAPLGFGTWQATVGTVSGLIAKENVVSTLGVLYGVGEVSEDGMEFWPLMAQDFTALAAFSFLLFNLLCAPCFAAIGAIRTETGSRLWTGFALTYLCVFAYGISFLVYQFGLVLTGSAWTMSTSIALALVLFLVFLIFRRPRAAFSLQTQGA